MQSVYILFICVAAVTAAPLPGGKAPKKLPFCDDLKTISEMSQAGFTKGGAAISSTTSTQGEASTKCLVRTPTSLKTITAAGNSGVSGSSAAADFGLFKQAAKAGTEIKNTGDGISVKTANLGTGITAGTAVSKQKADANGAVNVKAISAALQKSKDGLAAIKKALQGTATSSSGHSGSSTGDGVFKVENKGGTKILFDKLAKKVKEAKSG